jgi:hypothetical protein
MNSTANEDVLRPKAEALCELQGTIQGLMDQKSVSFIGARGVPQKGKPIRVFLADFEILGMRRAEGLCFYIGRDGRLFSGYLLQNGEMHVMGWKRGAWENEFLRSAKDLLEGR